jgi:hypothetical protein
MRLTPRQQRIKEFLMSGTCAVLLIVFLWSVKSCIVSTF